MGCHGNALAPGEMRLTGTAMGGEFNGKKMLVTGASSGLGQACALHLARCGAQVAAVSRKPCTIADLGLPESSALFMADLSNEVDVKRLAQELKQSVGSLDGCVFAAGLHSFRPIMMEGYSDLVRVWAANVQSCLGLIAALSKTRLLAKGSSLVLFSSASARAGSAGAVSYAACKGAIESATFSLAMEFAGQGIRVNAVSPGVVPTPMSEQFMAKLTPDQRARLEAHHPLGFGTPQDVAGPVAFLLSSAARWVNGVVLPVDGGFSIV
jgi:NAD(P)-dependent dehydrogenase (short-subunit alcohol dehydrogenase family)